MTLRTHVLCCSLVALLALTGCENETPWRDLSNPGAMAGYGRDNWPFDDHENGTLHRDAINPDTSGTVADLLLHLPYGLMFVAAAFFAWFHRRNALVERGFDPRSPLRDGPGVVFGTVEAEPGWQGPLVRVDIHQAGREWQNKGQWGHSWTETQRNVNTRPFAIVRDDGVRVMVEPSPNVIVRDRHDKIIRHNYMSRTRVAEITAGERVHVTGVVAGAAQNAYAGAYRASVGTPVVRPPSVGRMVISAEAPGDTSLARMRFHRNWAIALVVLFTFAVSVIMPTFEVLSLTGHTEWATPTAVRNWRVWVKPKNSPGYWAYHYAVRGTVARDSTTLTVDDETGPSVHRAVEEGSCAMVPFVVSTVAPSVHQFGTAPYLTVGRAIFLGFLCLILVIAYPASVVSSRPWYMKKKVVDSGGGRLEASKP